MSKVVSCKCGASIRLPDRQDIQSFRCPKCKSVIAAPAAENAISASQLGPDGAGATCPICQSTITAEESVVACPKCDQVHHSECWSEVGGCGTYGCDQAPSQEKGSEGIDPPLSAWGDDKSCPACGETIKAIAVKCRYCGTDFGTVDPLTLGDLRRQVRKGEALQTLQKTVIALFVLSLFGCLAPLIAIVGMCVLLPKHKQLVEQGPLYLVLGYASIALSLLYSVLMLLFATF